MNTLTRTIIVFVVVNLMTAGLALAQEIENPALPAPSSERAVAGPSVSAIEPAEVESFAAADTAAVNLKRTRSLASNLSSRTRSTGSVFVIPSEQTSTEDLLTINEDMSVMSRIFEKNIEQTRISAARGSIFDSRRDPYWMLMGGGRGGIQSMYLQGYGALFLMKVDFPLSPPPQAQEEKETQKAKEGDPVWDQVRREIYDPEQVDIRRRTDRPESKYDAEKVENLKTTIIKALKHAANIRILKTDESVILSVTGKSVSDGIVQVIDVSGTDEVIAIVDVQGKHVQKYYKDGLPEDIKFSSPTVLVIRAKKSDIDTFAKGDLDFDKFREKVQILSYPLLGENITGTSSTLVLPTTRSTGGMY